MGKKKKTYTPAPTVPPDLAERMRIILEVQSGVLTVSEAARRLGMSRNHFQTLMHSALAGMIDGLEPGKAGRPAKPAREAELESEVQTLKKQLHRLEEKSAMAERMLGLVGEMLGKTKAQKRETPRKPTTKAETDDESELRATVTKMHDIGASNRVIACVIGRSEATIRRRLDGQDGRRVARRIPPSAEQITRLDARVRATRGQVGAEALSKAEQVSRRTAAIVKHQTCTTMERERIAASARVSVTTPGVIRGFDQMYIWTDRGRAFLLPMTDATVPFRTSCAFANRYDERAVADAIRADFERNGAPLVLRLDRARQHRTPLVRAVLARHGVLALHGPPHHPRFYGQLERQNREHRAYFGHDERVPSCDVTSRRDAMLAALNDAWPRRALAWQTPLHAWTKRPELRDNRHVLRQEVEHDATTWRARGLDEDTATRFAIQRALTERGYLNVVGGSAC
jgi:hypothetical protein